MTRKSKRQHPAHPFLAQMLFRPIGRTQDKYLCASAAHREKSDPVPDIPRATWEVRMYTNTERLLALYSAGVSREEIAEALWQEACREQDTVGVVVHQVMQVCDECAGEVLSRHSGEVASFLNFTTAAVTGQAIVLVSDRLTERAGLVGGFPGDIAEKDILARLDDEDMTQIVF